MHSVLKTVSAISPTAEKHLALLALGGTIAGVSKSSTEYAGYTAAVTDISDIMSAVPALSKVAHFKAQQLLQVASQDLTQQHLLVLAREVNRLLSCEGCMGVIITQGTNTLEETAFFLNLVVKSPKPVVVTGAMRPATSLSADGPMNLYRAAVVAASEQAWRRGVMVVMNDQILGARDVHKTDTMTVDSFKSPLFGVMGLVLDDDCRFYRGPIRRHTEESDFSVDAIDVLPRVDIVYGYQDDDRTQLDACIAAGAKGIVLAGAGTASISSRVLPSVIDAVQKGIAVVRVSRSSMGVVGQNMEFDDRSNGTLAGDTLNAPKARILLMLALTQWTEHAKLQQCFDKY